MRALYNIKDMIEDELKEISKKGELTDTDLENVYKMVDICKDISTIEAMEQSRYSRDYSNYSSENYPMSYEGSYRSYDSYARRGRDGDGDGRYSERSYRDGGMSREGYSGHTPEQIRMKMEEMMRNAKTEQERENIRRVMQQI